MEAKVMFWNRKSISNPNSPDTENRRTIPVLSYVEWTALPPESRGVYVDRSREGYFQETEFSLSNFEWQSVTDINVVDKLTVTKVYIKIDGIARYCYLYKKMGIRMKFLRVDDFHTYFEPWTYMGNQVYEKVPVAQESDHEISFRPSMGFDVRNRESLGDEELLEETICQQQATPLPAERN